VTGPFIKKGVIGPTLKSAAGAALETLVNQALKLDPASRQRLTAMDGQIFHIECTAPAVDIYLLPQHDRVQIASYCDGPITAGLRGSADDFIQLLTSADPGATLINGKMTVQGDSQALLQLRAIAADLDIDWEAPLVQVFGDVIGHQLGRGLQQMTSLLQEAGRSFSRQLRDYVKEESDWLAPRWQVENFKTQVDELVRRSETLEARAAQLRQQILRRQHNAPRR
jgi:ubiquinone biosynthesis accessory factor UbiJ